jgi:hypothetical protein
MDRLWIITIVLTVLGLVTLGISLGIGCGLKIVKC